MQPSPKCQSPGRGHSGQYATVQAASIPLTIPDHLPLPDLPIEPINKAGRQQRVESLVCSLFDVLRFLALKNALPHGVRQKTIGIFLRAACPGISGMAMPAIEPRIQKGSSRTLTYAECHHDFWQLTSCVHDDQAGLSAPEAHQNMYENRKIVPNNPRLEFNKLNDGLIDF